jgi:hypothetical protein
MARWLHDLADLVDEGHVVPDLPARLALLEMAEQPLEIVL